MQNDLLNEASRKMVRPSQRNEMAEWVARHGSASINLASRAFRTLNVLENFNRDGLAIEVDFSLAAERAVRAFDQIILWRRKSLSIRVDNGLK